MNQDQNIEYVLAGNLSNMIGQQALQVTHLQIALKRKDEELKQKDNLIAELKHQVNSLRGEGGAGDKRSISITGQQDKH